MHVCGYQYDVVPSKMNPVLHGYHKVVAAFAFKYFCYSLTVNEIRKT